MIILIIWLGLFFFLSIPIYYFFKKLGWIAPHKELFYYDEKFWMLMVGVIVAATVLYLLVNVTIALI